ncbi:hypothetical protein GCM10007979_26470 [Nocardioides albus]|nr:hypothetical protein GCM10007979_26470 [Nocardioides albus]
MGSKDSMVRRPSAAAGAPGSLHEGQAVSVWMSLSSVTAFPFKTRFVRYPKNRKGGYARRDNRSAPQSVDEVNGE